VYVLASKAGILSAHADLGCSLLVNHFSPVKLLRASHVLVTRRESIEVDTSVNPNLFVPLQVIKPNAYAPCQKVYDEYYSCIFVEEASYGKFIGKCNHFKRALDECNISEQRPHHHHPPAHTPCQMPCTCLCLFSLSVSFSLSLSFFISLSLFLYLSLSLSLSLSLYISLSLNKTIKIKK